MYYKRKFQMGVAAVIAVAACSDRVHAPLAPGGDPANPKPIAGALPATNERVTVTRTTSVRAPVSVGDAGRGRTLQRTQTFTVGAGQVALRDEDLAMKAALAPRLRERPTSVDELPVVGLTFPAGTRSLRAAVVPWHTTTSVADDPDLMVESRGVGSAPASEIRFERNGTLAMTVVQEWELWQGQWNLVRRETSTADSSVREVIEVLRTGRTGGALQSAASWSRGVGTGASLAPAYDLYADDASCGRCGKEIIAEDAAFKKWLSRNATALGLCLFVPPPATVPTCIVALTATLDAAADWDKARAELALCQATAPKCPPPAPPTPTGGCVLATSSAGTRGGRSFDCAFPTDGGLPTEPAAPSGAPGGGTAPSGHNECTYYYEYDLYTGAVTFSQLLYCVWVPGV